jgi:hypothetical protein
MKQTIATLLMLFSANLVAQDSQTPQISAVFDRIDNGPAFFVACRNTSGEPVSSGADVWASSLRLDGTTVPDEPHRGPGLTTEVKPGAVVARNRSSQAVLQFVFSPRKVRGIGADRTRSSLKSRAAYNRRTMRRNVISC